MAVVLLRQGDDARGLSTQMHWCWLSLSQVILRLGDEEPLRGGDSRAIITRINANPCHDPLDVVGSE